MPIYEYVCANCGYKFELRRPFGQADEVALCPRCHASAKRILSIVASHLVKDMSELPSSWRKT